MNERYKTKIVGYNQDIILIGSREAENGNGAWHS